MWNKESKREVFLSPNFVKVTKTRDVISYVKHSLLIIAFVFVFVPSKINNNWDYQYVRAEDGTTNLYYSINLDEPTIAKGYTVEGFNELKLSLVPGILSEDTRVDIIQLNEVLDMPWELDRISHIYQFEFRNKAAYDDHKPFYIQFAYAKEDNDHKQVFFYDKNFKGWRPLPTRDFPEEKFVRSLIHLPYARIAVFSYPEKLTFGRASWYAYKPGNFSASPDFPKGSRLRVTNIENDKYVDVVVNDYGPDRSLHPDRVVDLEKNAFAKIASLSEGMIEVNVEPLYIAPDDQGKVLGISAAGIGVVPEVSLKAAIIMRESDSGIIYSKNSSEILPLASLTKMVALKIFMETEPDLSRVVAYSEKDEEYNYEYVKKWESARLRVVDGETLSIEDLIYSSLTGSTNNTVETLVRVSGMTRADFISRMNETVRSWGASSTKFYEPTGLAPENVSSAADYAIITKEVLRDPIIEKASSILEYKFETINMAKAHNIKNTNHIIRTNQYPIKGSKTGYLDEAGYCLMTRVAAAGGENIIVVTFGAETRDISFNETEELIKYGLRKLEN